MSRVVRSGHFVQWFFGVFLVLVLSVAIGCQPKAEKKATTPKQPTSTKGAAADQAKPAAKEAVKEKELPGVETPVKEMPNPEPAKAGPAKTEPAKVEPPKTEPAKVEPPKTEPAKPEPAKEPAKKAEEKKTSAVAAPVAAKVAADQSMVSNASLEVAVKWLPKPTANAESEAKDQAGMKKYVEQVGNTDVKFEMVPIPGGSFKMGSPANEKDRKDDEGPQVEVKIDPFWMEAHETTWEEYEQWGLGIDLQRRKAKNAPETEWNKAADALAIPSKPYSGDMTFGMGKEGYPAVCMTQFAAKMYCKWLSAKTGRYYRLPTEAEWEYACRCRFKQHRLLLRTTLQNSSITAWFEGNSEEKYQKIAKKKPNAVGPLRHARQRRRVVLGSVRRRTATSNWARRPKIRFYRSTRPIRSPRAAGRGPTRLDCCGAPLAAVRARIGRCKTRRFRKAFGTSPMPIS